MHVQYGFPTPTLDPDLYTGAGLYASHNGPCSSASNTQPWIKTRPWFPFPTLSTAQILYVLFHTLHNPDLTPIYRCRRTRSTHPLLNFLNGGLITAFLLITQCLPIRTLARSPRITQSVMMTVWKKNIKKWTYHKLSSELCFIAREVNHLLVSCRRYRSTDSSVNMSTFNICFIIHNSQASKYESCMLFDWFNQNFHDS